MFNVGYSHTGRLLTYRVKLRKSLSRVIALDNCRVFYVVGIIITCASLFSADIIGRCSYLFLESVIHAAAPVCAVQTPDGRAPDVWCLMIPGRVFPPTLILTSRVTSSCAYYCRKGFRARSLLIGQFFIEESTTTY